MALSNEVFSNPRRQKDWARNVLSELSTKKVSGDIEEMLGKLLRASQPTSWAQLTSAVLNTPPECQKLRSAYLQAVSANSTRVAAQALGIVPAEQVKVRPPSPRYANSRFVSSLVGRVNRHAVGFLAVVVVVVITLLCTGYFYQRGSLNRELRPKFEELHTHYIAHENEMRECMRLARRVEGRRERVQGWHGRGVLQTRSRLFVSNAVRLLAEWEKRKKHWKAWKQSFTRKYRKRDSALSAIEHEHEWMVRKRKELQEVRAGLEQVLGEL